MIVSATTSIDFLHLCFVPAVVKMGVNRKKGETFKKFVLYLILLQLLYGLLPNLRKNQSEVVFFYSVFNFHMVF